MSIAIPVSEMTSAPKRPVTGPLADRMAKPDASERQTYDSRDLLQGAKEVLIEHRGELYRLRLTGTGKLYLTK